MRVKKSHFSHQALFYESDEKFLEGIVSLVQRSLDAGEPTLIAVGSGKGEPLVRVWRDFLDRAPSDARPLLGIGESVRSGRAWSLLCPYDSAALDDDVLQSARESHEDVPSAAKAMRFGRSELAQARELVAGEADQARLGDSRRTDLVVAVNELAANSVLHGGGGGKLQVWREPDALVAEVRDEGRIEDPLVGRVQPTPTQEGGRGLWMVNQLCDLVQIRSGPEGTSVRLRMSLN